MTPLLKRINEGREGIICSTNTNDILKIYKVSLIAPNEINTNFVKSLYGFNTLDDLLQNRFNLLETAHAAGLKVPKPLGIEIMTLEESYDKFGNHDSYIKKIDKITKQNPELAKKLKTQTVYGLRKQYIEGKSLDRNFFPSLKLKRLVQQTYKDFYDKGIIIQDERPSNFVLTKNNELYMIDEGSIYFKNCFHPVKNNTYGFHTYYGDKILLGYYLLENYMYLKRQLKMIKKEREKY